MRGLIGTVVALSSYMLDGGGGSQQYRRRAQAGRNVDSRDVAEAVGGVAFSVEAGRMKSRRHTRFTLYHRDGQRGHTLGYRDELPSRLALHTHMALQRSI